LIKKIITEIQAYIQTGQDEPDKDFMIVSLDLLSGVIQALSINSAALIQSDPSLFTVLLICMKDPISEVRQSAYALLGDLAIHVYPLLRPHLTTYIPEAIHEIREDVEISLTSVVNNAIWALGEMMLRDNELKQYVPHIFEKVVKLFGRDETVRTLSDNCAIALGRMGVYYSEIISDAIHYYIQKWCLVMKFMKDNHEKESSLYGMTRTLLRNPAPLVELGCLPVFIEICGMNTMRDETVEAVKGLLAGYKTMVGNQWEQLLLSLGEKAGIIRRFGL
jgi:hypothetical protein